MRSNRLRVNRIKTIVGVILFFALLFVVFYQYQENLFKRTSEQNTVFAIEETKKSVDYINREFESAKAQIESYAYMVNSRENIVEVDSDLLFSLEKQSEFDFVRYTDRNGFNHTSHGYANNQNSYAGDRDYYLYGMRGESGISIVMESRINQETMICFYAPLIAGNKPYGVLRGVYTANSYLKNMLDAKFFEHKVEAYICSKDGKIIATNSTVSSTEEIGAYFIKKNYLDEKNKEELLADIKKGFSGSFSLDRSFATNIICVEPILDGELSLIKVFPEEVTSEMVLENSKSNIQLLVLLASIVVIFGICFILNNRKLRKDILKENEEMHYLIKGTADFSDKSVLVDLENGTYAYLNNGLPLSPSIPKKGNYLDFYHLILSTIVSKEERSYMEEVIAPDKLQKLFLDDTKKNFGHVYEVNRNGEKSWEHIFVICIETKFKVPTKALFIRMDYTEIQEENIRSAEVVKRAMRDAEMANEAKSSFLANMSHEIRTPINAVLGMNAMIMRETSLENIKGHAKDIQNAGRSLLAIINDILDFSKIESGKMELTPVSYDTESLLHDSYNIIRPRITEKELNFVVDVDPKIPTTLYGDEIRIRQIMINLLTNAVKYTKEGTVTLHMHYRTISSDTIKLIIEVRDTGIGITKENLRKLFRSFQRVEEVRNRTIEGTGLGLSITKSFVEMMEGSITVESEYGKGSVFTAEIPQKTIDKTPMGEWNPEAVVYEEEMVYEEPFHAPDAHILVVDDTEMNLRVFKGLVKDLQMQVDTAKSGGEALEKLAQQDYDIVFMDFRMPVMDGVETLHAFKKTKSARNKETPFIVLTANAMSGAKEEYQSEGFDDYISKPIKEDVLISMIEEYLPRELIVYRKDFDKEKSVTVKEEVIPETEPAKKEEKPQSVTAPSDFSEAEGLAYCADDMDLYKEMIGMYIEDAENVEEELTSYLANNDMKNYNVRVHALKSTSRTLGIMGVGEMAFFLEKRSEEGDLATVSEKHEELMQAFRDMVSFLKIRYDF